MEYNYLKKYFFQTIHFLFSKNYTFLEPTEKNIHCIFVCLFLTLYFKNWIKIYGYCIKLFLEKMNSKQNCKQLAYKGHAQISKKKSCKGKTNFFFAGCHYCTYMQLPTTKIIRNYGLIKLKMFTLLTQKSYNIARNTNIKQFDIPLTII